MKISLITPPPIPASRARDFLWHLDGALEYLDNLTEPRDAEEREDLAGCIRGVKTVRDWLKGGVK